MGWSHGERLVRSRFQTMKRTRDAACFSRSTCCDWLSYLVRSSVLDHSALQLGLAFGCETRVRCERCIGRPAKSRCRLKKHTTHSHGVALAAPVASGPFSLAIHALLGLLPVDPVHSSRKRDTRLGPLCVLLALSWYQSRGRAVVEAVVVVGVPPSRFQRLLAQ